MFFDIVSVITMGSMLVFSVLVVSLFYGCTKFMVKYHTTNIPISVRFTKRLVLFYIIIIIGIIAMSIAIRM